jgi:hypothetical protein
MKLCLSLGMVCAGAALAGCAWAPPSFVDDESWDAAVAPPMLRALPLADASEDASEDSETPEPYCINGCVPIGEKPLVGKVIR